MNTLRSKQLYKVFLSIVKYIPNILAICKILGLILNKLHIKSFLLTCFGGTSLVLIILLYLISFIFRFCGTYRLSLHYVTIIHVITIIDYYIGIPLSIENIYTLYTVISGVFMILWIIIWYKNRANSKIDHIKRLCDNYADCNC